MSFSNIGVVSKKEVVVREKGELELTFWTFEVTNELIGGQLPSEFFTDSSKRFLSDPTHFVMAINRSMKCLESMLLGEDRSFDRLLFDLGTIKRDGFQVFYYSPAIDPHVSIIYFEESVRVWFVVSKVVEFLYNANEIHCVN